MGLLDIGGVSWIFRLDHDCSEIFQTSSFQRHPPEESTWTARSCGCTSPTYKWLFCGLPLPVTEMRVVTGLLLTPISCTIQMTRFNWARRLLLLLLSLLLQLHLVADFWLDVRRTGIEGERERPRKNRAQWCNSQQTEVNCGAHRTVINHLAGYQSYLRCCIVECPEKVGNIVGRWRA